MTTPAFAAEAAAILPELQALRRDLHRAPELGLLLPETQRRVLGELDPLGLEVTLGERLTSIVAVLRGGRPGPTVLLRGDMDALPVVEQTGLDFASTNGRMHACGHDLHTAGLVGAARLLTAHRDRLAGDVVFMFQPGEEGYGGARIMIEEGLLEASGQKPVAAYGIHVAPGPFGTFVTRPGAIAAGSNELTITVRGRGGHGSQPHQVLDPVPVAAEIVLALQSFVTRRFDVFDPIVLSVTQLQGSEAVNVIPETATLRATVRTLSVSSQRRVAEEAPRLAEHIAAAHGMVAEAVFEEQYPVTINDPAAAEETLAWLGEAFGEPRVQTLPNPGMGSEDFSFVLNEVPGAFVMLATSPPDSDHTTAEFNHSPRVIFDDAVLGDQAAALATLAWRKLESLAD
ncbi:MULTISPECIES: M20 metallopeptidase family protein [unclassified Leucobacter]|uniref:M20 metallopeptidase family protein n=1 Tax=unclassified Leucobacter TaxID=2621730 RepID=UPI000622481B|nr:M20 family metallopeptidase [Leucobacter sp. Ag1]KKI19676.1 amidohydrolase [Leucobacter sp. Ag1]